MGWSLGWTICKFCGERMQALSGRSRMPNRLYSVGHYCDPKKGGCGAALEVMEKDNGEPVPSADNWYDPQAKKWDYVFGAGR